MNDTIPWVEKYRPTEFDDIVLSPTNRLLFEQIIKKQYFPNLLFYGPPGTGKTTSIINLINKYNQTYNKHSKGLIIHLNASDERGIDIIRNQILQFVKTTGFFNNGIKFVILDEVDYMTKNAQYALKYLLQSYTSSKVRFCLICNYISKVEESLKNEFVCFRFNQLPKLKIQEFIMNIVHKEGLNMNPSAVNIVQDLFNSDIRSMINFIQSNYQHSMQTTNILTNEVWERIHTMIQDNIIVTETETNITCVLDYMHDISVRYNTDKNALVKKYFNYIIRWKPEIVSNEFLHIGENIMHTETVEFDDLLEYMCIELHEYYDRITKN